MNRNNPQVIVFNRHIHTLLYQYGRLSVFEIYLRYAAISVEALMMSTKYPLLPESDINTPPVHSLEYIKALWPEYYGFSIAGEGPAYVVSASQNGVAHHAGIRAGDQVGTSGTPQSGIFGRHISSMDVTHIKYAIVSVP